MEKILLPFNSAVYTSNALEFAAYLARLTGSAITGLFLEDLVHITDTDAIAAKKQLTEKNINFFKQGCEARSIRYRVKRETGMPVIELIRESRYADVAVMDAATSFSDVPEHIPTAFVKHVLSGAECPSIIAPQHFDEIGEIVFMYDGSRSSVFAARQFTYLFPQLDDRKVSIIEVDNGHTVPDQDRAAMKIWVKEHYSSIGFTALQGDPAAAMFSYLLNKKNVFVITGAYGRNALSRFFRESTAEMLIKTISHAFFIAHY